MADYVSVTITLEMGGRVHLKRAFPCPCSAEAKIDHQACTDSRLCESVSL